MSIGRKVKKGCLGLFGDNRARSKTFEKIGGQHRFITCMPGQGVHGSVVMDVKHAVARVPLCQDLENLQGC